MNGTKYIENNLRQSTLMDAIANGGKQMNAEQPLPTTSTELVTIHLNNKILVDTNHLMLLLDCGKHTAVKIGHLANACVRLDRKLFWNVQRIKDYVDNIAG